MFLIFINDLPDIITENSSSKVALFADVSKIYKSVKSVQDCIDLQNSTDKTFQWSNKWNMSFYASKCTTLSVTRQRHTFGIHEERDNWL